MSSSGRITLPRFTDRKSLGRAQLSVSPFCLGLVSDPKTICEAFDAGINFFFVTADMHWPEYEATRRGLELLFARHPSIRDDVVIASASYVTQPEFCTIPFFEVVRSIAGLQRLDITVMGGAYAGDLLGRLAKYRTHSSNESIRSKAIGASLHDRHAAAVVVNDNLADVAFVRYNAAHRGAESEIFSRLSSDRKPLLYNFRSTSSHVADARLRELGIPDANWRPSISDSYRFVLSQPELDGLLFAVAKSAHLTELDEAMARGPLSAAERDYMGQIAELDAGNVALESP